MSSSTLPPPATPQAPPIVTPSAQMPHQPITSLGPPMPGQQATLPRHSTPKRSIYDRNLNRSRNAELSRASFALIFGEMVTYAQRRVKGIADLEKRLNNQGYTIGLKLLDLLLYRAPTPFSATTTAAATSLRPIRVLPLLQFISTTLWRHLFGRPADTLERSQDSAAEYMITDNDPVVNAYISVPKEMNQLNCAAYVAGIIEGICDGCGFYAKVSAHSVAEDEAATRAKEGGTAKDPAVVWPGKTIFLVKFSDEVMEREELLAKAK